MKFNHLFGIIIICISVFFSLHLILDNTYAYQYKFNNYTLFYKDNKDELEKNIKKYIDDIDDLLIANSSYELSDNLSENYMFLVNFAIDYIIDNYENYKKKIIKLDKYRYIDRELNEKVVDDYVDIEEIYNITFKYFGVKDFQIINDNVNIIDNYISLTDYTEKRFKLKISSISISYDNNKVLANVLYDNNYKYLYIFNNYNNVLKISNVEVIEWNGLF